MFVVLAIMRKYVDENKGIDTLAPIIYYFALSLHTGQYRIEDKCYYCKQQIDPDCNCTARNFKLLQINDDKSFCLTIKRKSYQYSWNGYIRIVEENKYLMLFPHFDGLQFKKEIKKKIDPKLRHNIYTKRVIELYKRSVGRFEDDEELKKYHKEFIMKYLKKKKSVSCKDYDSYKLEWNVLSMKLKYDIKRNRLNNIDDDGGMNDIHYLYECLCKHFDVEPEGMYLGELYINVYHDGKETAINMNNQSMFSDRFILQK